MLIFVDKFVMFCRATDGICSALVAVRFGAPHEEKTTHFNGRGSKKFYSDAFGR
jgi:hypothetical protein